MTTYLTAVTAGTIQQGANANATGSATAIQAAVAVQFVGDNGAGGLTAQLGALTTQLTAVNAGTIEVGTAAQAGSATAIVAARDAVQATMTEIERLKGAEGLSDTVVDAIGILENAWAELGEVRLGNANENAGTALSAITAAEIQGVTQEQVDTLRELN